MRRLSEIEIRNAYMVFNEVLEAWSSYGHCKILQSVERVKEYFNDHQDELDKLDFKLMRMLLEDRRAEKEENEERFNQYFNAFIDYHIRTKFFGEEVEFARPDEVIKIPQSQSFFGSELVENNFSRATLPPEDEFTEALKVIGRGKGVNCYILFQPSSNDQWIVSLLERLVNDLRKANIYAATSSSLTAKYGTMALIASRNEPYKHDKFIVLATPALKQACGKFDDLFDEKLGACLTRIEVNRKVPGKAEPLLPVMLQGNTTTAVPDAFVSLFNPKDTINAGAVKEGYKLLLDKIIQHCFNNPTLTLDNVVTHSFN